jgi:twinkle protein
MKAMLSAVHAEHLEQKRRIRRDLAERCGVVSRGSLIGFEYRLAPNDPPLHVKWRGPDKKFFSEPTGVSHIPWGLDTLSQLAPSELRTLIITEGEFDRLAVMSAGYSSVLSVPDGAPNSVGEEKEIVPKEDAPKFAWMWAGEVLRPELARPERIILAVDSDSQGRALREELIVRLSPEKCWLVVYPEGCKDANDVLVHHGPERLVAIIEAARPVIENRLVSLSDLPIPAPRDVFLSGWATLDPHLRVVPPELVVVTGSPGSGKSQFTVNLCLNISKKYGVRGAIIQLEDDIERTRNDLEAYAQSFFAYADRETGEVTDPAEWLNEHIRLVLPSVEKEDTRDLAWVEHMIWEAAARHSCRWVVIDPWNEVEHAWAKNGSETDYQNTALRDLKRLARRYNIALFIVAHPDKSGGRTEGIDEMTLYSISGGAAFKNKADHGIIVARETGENGFTPYTFIKIDKSKNHVLMGTPGKVKMELDMRSRTYREARE